jgi:2,4-dienoyl-CoA reductase-like NADH-dependent reductase (Old Yellow Enzyme family)/thioredoxin reductase
LGWLGEKGLRRVRSNQVITGVDTRGRVPQKLFTPINIRTMQVKNRLCLAPIGGLAKLDGTIPQQYKDFFVARAQGGVGMIVLSSVDFAHLEVPLQASVAERVVGEIREVVQAVHDYDVRVGVQLHHSGRQIPPVSLPGYEVVAASPIPWSPRSPIPRELSVGEIEELIERHVSAAMQVKETGSDFVEVKACHGYLLSNFLSPHSNRRTDEYGGDIEGRARFTLEVIKRIRQAVGDEFLICCRLNGSDYVKGGLTLEEAKVVAPQFVAAGADFLSVSAGVYGSYPVIVPPFDTPHGCFVHLAEGIKSVVSVPIIAVGRITEPWMAEDILDAGKADIVAMARALIADPDLPTKARRGEFNDIRRCIGCNQGCQDVVPGWDLTCLVNPAAGREREMDIIPATRAKKVLVIGGGPAGLEAARVAALRGHKVILCEEERELGGQWRLAAIPPHKQEFAEFLSYQLRQLKELGVEVRLGKSVTAAVVDEEKPDVAIVAAGARPLIPPMPGVEGDNVTNAWDVLAGKSETGHRVLVVGGNRVGLETAYFLASLGKTVTVVEMLEHTGRDLGPTVRWHLRHRLAEQGVQLLTSTRVEGISNDGISVSKGAGQEIWQDFDTVVLTTDTSGGDKLVEKIKKNLKEVYVIGDAAEPRNAFHAIREGAEVGRKV